MSRPRDFDEATVLDAAIDQFWNHGYAATSVRDLGEVMGLGPASLYNAFGDKNTLFSQCLARYLDKNMRDRIARLEQSLPPRDAVRAFLEQTVSESLADPRGCMLVNAALEVAPHDTQINAVVAARLEELESFFRGRVAAGQADGSISGGRTPEDLARLLLTTVLGLRVLARTRPEPALLRSAADQALSLLDAA